jgi:gamma-glutamyltranspeptidase
MGPSSADTLHTLIEAYKLAALDTSRFVGNPREVQAPVKGLLDKAYAARRASAIDPRKANCPRNQGSRCKATQCIWPSSTGTVILPPSFRA